MFLFLGYSQILCQIAKLISFGTILQSGYNKNIKCQNFLPF